MNRKSFFFEKSLKNHFPLPVRQGKMKVKFQIQALPVMRRAASMVCSRLPKAVRRM